MGAAGNAALSRDPKQGLRFPIFKRPPRETKITFLGENHAIVRTFHTDYFGRTDRTNRSCSDGRWASPATERIEGHGFQTGESRTDSFFSNRHLRPVWSATGCKLASEWRVWCSCIAKRPRIPELGEDIKRRSRDCSHRSTGNYPSYIWVVV